MLLITRDPNGWLDHPFEPERMIYRKAGGLSFPHRDKLGNREGFLDKWKYNSCYEFLEKEFSHQSVPPYGCFDVSGGFYLATMLKNATNTFQAKEKKSKDA